MPYLPMQAGQICAVLEEHGEEHLETWQVPMLTWDELQELKQLYEAAPVSALESPLGGEQHDCLNFCLCIASLSAEDSPANVGCPSVEVARGSVRCA